MACFNPLHGYPVPNARTVNGKQAYQILGMSDKLYDRKECILIPCGKCIGCRLSYARQWADRCMLELQYHDSAYFVTLTYNDVHVPKSFYGDPDTGLAQPVLTLCRRDVQLFFKRLRRVKPNDSIRYFGCAEYGPNTFRPHYHVIIFGLHLDDLKLKRQDVDGKVNAWTSDTLQAAWSERPFGNYSPILDSLGDVECSDVTWAACNYTARYIVNKQLGPDGKDFYDAFNIVSPFTFMSRRPGIGRWYFDSHDDIYSSDTISISTPTGGRSIKPPRYYDKLYDIDHPEEMASIKEIRRTMAENAQRYKLSRTSLSVFDLQELEQRRVLEKVPKEFDI